MFSGISYYEKYFSDGSLRRTVSVLEGLDLESLQESKPVEFMTAREYFYGGTVIVETAFSVEKRPDGEYLIGYEKTSKNYEDPNEIHWDSDFAETISKAQYLIDSAKRDWLEGATFLGTEEFENEES